MPNWLLDIQAWLFENWFWLTAAAVILADIVGAVEMSKVAYAKGYSRVKYLIICLLFTLLGYIIIIALPDIEQAERDEEMIDTLRQMSVKLTRANTRLKKLSLSTKQRVPEVVRRMAAPEDAAEAEAPATPAASTEPATAPTLRTRDALSETEKAERRSHFAPVVAPSEAISILETAVEFETDIGLKNYLTRKYEKADDATKAALDQLMHVSDEGLRRGAAKLLANMKR